MTSMKILGALLLSWVTTGAMAHAHLQKAVPADGAVVTASPANVVLSFSEPAHLTAFWIQKDDGVKQKIGPLAPEPARQITIPLPQLAPGTYVVSWRVLGDDSHIVPGQIRFTVAAGTAAEKH
ncbi:MAG: copper resistance protein CopC [Gammaproteobacteria bacterium]|jgi:methionine-rich copper-binding protein CopC|nr:copper resistance protein CopC [Gammaproteobacteria bacterium]